MRKIKLLWVGDAVAQTGFSRVTHSVLNNLPEVFDINVLGVNYFGDPHPYPYKIWPARGRYDLMGFERLPKLLETIRPDFIMLFNDVWVIADYVKVLRDYKGKIGAYFPVDSCGYKPEWCEMLKNLDFVGVYTDFAVSVLREAGFDKEVKVIPHGVELDIYHPIGKSNARKQVQGLTDDDFIVFNGNRNQPRKRIDITIKGFAKFAADKPNAKLYLHMGLTDMGWDIIPLCTREFGKYGLSPKDRLVVTHPNLSPANCLSEQQLNVVYNTADVGVNTSLGEGWGLVNVEQAACLVPQIVPDYSASKELFDGRGLLLPIRQYLSSLQINTEGGLVHEDDLAEALNTYYYNPDLAKRHAQAMYEYLLDPKFRWQNIALQFSEAILGCL